MSRFGVRGLSALLLLLLPQASALPSYRTRIPNGLKVPCPSGAEGCSVGDAAAGQPASVCNGLGHATCGGGTLPLNPFGSDFMAAGTQWTKDLCQKDSDGDGVTNGEELGDPCCLWENTDKPSPYMTIWTPTHPGFSSDKPTNYTAPNCTSADVQPASKAASTAAFNDWEEKRSMKWIINNYSIPERHTAYVNFVFNFDDETHDIFHVVYGLAIIDKPRHLHHFVVTGCTEKVPEADVGVPIAVPDHCNVPIGGFQGRAPGTVLWDAPTTAGFPIGKGVGILAVHVNVHYTDGDILPGEIAQDGIELFYTPTLRNYTIVNTLLIQVDMGPGNMYVPPGEERHFLTRKCIVEDICSDSAQCASQTLNCSRDTIRYACPQSCNVPCTSKPAKVTAASFHAHFLGHEMYTTITRNGTQVDIASTKIWDYNDQASVHLTADSLEVQEGDVLQTTCVYNSMNRTEKTLFGLSSYQEMCLNSVSSIHTTADVGKDMRQAFRCQGNLWEGKLKPNEDARQVADLYPESDAYVVWEQQGDTWTPGDGFIATIRDQRGDYAPGSCTLQEALVIADGYDRCRKVEDRISCILELLEGVSEVCRTCVISNPTQPQVCLESDNTPLVNTRPLVPSPNPVEDAAACVNAEMVLLLGSTTYEEAFQNTAGFSASCMTCMKDAAKDWSQSVVNGLQPVARACFEMAPDGACPMTVIDPMFKYLVGTLDGGTTSVWDAATLLEFAKVDPLCTVCAANRGLGGDSLRCLGPSTGLKSCNTMDYGNIILAIQACGLDSLPCLGAYLVTDYLTPNCRVCAVEWQIEILAQCILPTSTLKVTKLNTEEALLDHVTTNYGVAISADTKISSLTAEQRNTIADKITESVSIEGAKKVQAFVKVNHQISTAVRWPGSTKEAVKVTDWGQATVSKAVLQVVDAADAAAELGITLPTGLDYLTAVVDINRMDNAGQVISAAPIAFELSTTSTTDWIGVKVYSESSNEPIDLQQAGGIIQKMRAGLFLITHNHTSTYVGYKATCSDGYMNGDETAKDCGGSCASCDGNSTNSGLGADTISESPSPSPVSSPIGSVSVVPVSSAATVQFSFAAITSMLLSMATLLVC